MFRKPEREPVRVKREEWKEPSGRNVVQVELRLDTQEAAQGVSTLIEQAKDFKKMENPDKVAAHATWCGGYIAALVVTELITEEQANQIQELIDRGAHAQLNRLGCKFGERKRG